MRQGPVSDSPPVFIGTPSYPRPRNPYLANGIQTGRVGVLPAPAQPVPVQQGPVGDSLPALIGAPPYPRPCSRTPPATLYRRLLAPVGRSCTSEGA